MSVDKGAKITKRVIDQASGDRGRHYIWDSELRGFGVQVEKSGTKTYFVRYRPKGHGRDGSRRFYKLGRHGDLTPDEARDQAERTLGLVATGQDPVTDLKEALAAAVRRQTAQKVCDLAKLFLDEHVRAKRKPRTVASYELPLRPHDYPVIGESRIDMVSRANIETLHQKKTGSGGAANRMPSVVSCMYSFAAHSRH